MPPSCHYHWSTHCRSAKQLWYPHPIIEIGCGLQINCKRQDKRIVRISIRVSRYTTRRFGRVLVVNDLNVYNQPSRLRESSVVHETEKTVCKIICQGPFKCKDTPHLDRSWVVCCR